MYFEIWKFVVVFWLLCLLVNMLNLPNVSQPPSQNLPFCQKITIIEACSLSMAVLHFQSSFVLLTILFNVALGMIGRLLRGVPILPQVCGIIGLLVMQAFTEIDLKVILSIN